jgi:hypothetical protein
LNPQLFFEKRRRKSTIWIEFVKNMNGRIQSRISHNFRDPNETRICWWTQSRIIIYIGNLFEVRPSFFNTNIYERRGESLPSM